jgi:hypothetical protein
MKNLVKSTGQISEVEETRNEHHGTRLSVRTRTAPAIVLALAILAPTAARSDTGTSAIYLMKDGNLYGKGRIVSGSRYQGPMDAIATGGWTGKLSVAKGKDGGNYLYLMKDGNLYGAQLDAAGNYKTRLDALTTGGWMGEFAVAGNGHVYMMKDGHLWAGNLDGLRYTPSVDAIATGGWTGRCAVAKASDGRQYFYLMKDGNLYGGRLNTSGLGFEVPLRALATGGWTGTLAVANGTVFLMKDGNLYAAPLDGLSYSGRLDAIATSGWTGELAILPDVAAGGESEPSQPNQGPILSDARIDLPDANSNARLTLDYLDCFDTTDAFLNGPEDEIYFIISGVRSDRRPYRRVTGYTDIRPGGTITNKPLWEGRLEEGQSVELQITVMESDDDLASTYEGAIRLAGFIISAIYENPSIGMAVNEGVDKANDSGLLDFLHNRDDLVGSFALRITNDHGQMRVYPWQPEDRCYNNDVWGGQNSHWFDMNGEGSDYTAYLEVGSIGTVPIGNSNLLQNGSFEQYGASWGVDSWAGKGQASFQDGVATNGSRSLLLTSDAADDTRLLQTVSVKPYTSYRLSGWVKTQNVRITQEGGTVGANLGLYGGWEHSPSVVGTKDWTYVELVFNSGSRTQVQVAPRLGYWSSTATGKAWFDDLQLVEIKGGWWLEY